MPEYGYFLSRVMKPVTPTVGESGYFSSPEESLDPKLFSGEKIRPEIRSWIVNTLYKYWESKYHRPRDWSTVWIAGSGISYQWAASRGNGDLDILIGVDYDEFFDANPDYSAFDQVDLSAIFNQALHDDLWPITDRTHIRVNSKVWQGSPNSPNSSRPTSAVSIWTEAPSTISRSPTGSATTPFSGISNSPESHAGAGHVENPAVSVGSSSSLEGFASRARSGTSRSTTTSRSMDSPLMTTTGFWKNRVAAAPSVDLQTPGSVTDSSSSITATTPGGTEPSSALFATGDSVLSETQLRGLSEPLNTSESTEGDETVYSVTFYVNPNSTDIRDINPYAAYNLSSDEWTVHPPEGAAFDHSPAFYQYAESEAQTARSLVSRYNDVSNQAKGSNPGSPGWHNAMKQAELLVSQASSLYDSIHLGRKQAFAPGGSGYGDYYNFRWQYHKKQGTAQALHAVASAHHDAVAEYQQGVYGGPIDAADVVLRRAVMHTRGM